MQQEKLSKVDPKFTQIILYHFNYELVTSSSHSNTSLWGVIRLFAAVSISNSWNSLLHEVHYMILNRTIYRVRFKSCPIGIYEYLFSYCY